MILCKPLISVFGQQIVPLVFKPSGINFLLSKSVGSPIQKFVKCLHSGLIRKSFKLLNYVPNDFIQLKTAFRISLKSLSTVPFNFLEEKPIGKHEIRKRVISLYDNKISCRYSSTIVHDSGQQKDQTKSFRNIRKLLGELTVDERRDILLDLQLEEAAVRKKEAEEKLASWHWRSKFGRPTSVQQSKVDPSGTYCEIPQDWLMKKVAESSKITAPTFSDLKYVAVFNALPFVGFGFLDNFIMIVAGDYIDITIGTYLGISTMAAAALGNTISDLAGIGSAWYVEFLATKIGVKPPDLSQEQQDMPSTRWSANIGRGVGVCLGCLLGMFPLLLLSNHSRSDRKKHDGESHETK